MARGKLKNKVDQLVEVSEWQSNWSPSISSQIALEQHSVFSGAGSGNWWGNSEGHDPFSGGEHFSSDHSRNQQDYNIGDHRWDRREHVSISQWCTSCILGRDMPWKQWKRREKKSGKIRKGNSYLKATLTEVAWAASRTKGSAYSAIYHSLAKRRVKRRPWLP